MTAFKTVGQAARSGTPLDMFTLAKITLADELDNSLDARTSIALVKGLIDVQAAIFSAMDREVHTSKSDPVEDELARIRLLREEQERARSSAKAARRMLADAQ